MKNWFIPKGSYGYIKNLLYSLRGQIQRFHGQAADRDGFPTLTVHDRFGDHALRLHHGQFLKSAHLRGIFVDT